MAKHIINCQEHRSNTLTFLWLSLFSAHASSVSFNTIGCPSLRVSLSGWYGEPNGRPPFCRDPLKKEHHFARKWLVPPKHRSRWIRSQSCNGSATSLQSKRLHALSAHICSSAAPASCKLRNATFSMPGSSDRRPWSRTDRKAPHGTASRKCGNNLSG